MEAAGSSPKSVNYCQTTRRHIPKYNPKKTDSYVTETKKTEQLQNFGEQVTARWLLDVFMSLDTYQPLSAKLR